MIITRLATSRAATCLALGGTLALTLGAGSANAALNCTFGTISSCAGTIGKLTFSNFNATGSYENNDTLNISVNSLGIYNILASFSPGTSVTGSGDYSFDVAAAPGYSLDGAAVNSTVDLFGTGGPFVFTTSLSGFAPNPMVSTAGSSATAASTNSSTSALITWDNGGGSKKGESSLLQLTTNPPTQTVPGPLPILGAASAFGFSRKLRRQIKARA